jgi:hypothetical protein
MKGKTTHDWVPAMPKEFNLSDIREISEIMREKPGDSSRPETDKQGSQERGHEG